MNIDATVTARRGHKHLDQANCRVALAQKHIAEQKKLIEKLEREGAPEIDVVFFLLKSEKFGATANVPLLLEMRHLTL